MKKIFAIVFAILMGGAVWAQETATTFEEAREAVIDGRYADAVPYLRKMVNADKKDWISAYYLSRCMYGLNEYDEQIRLGEIVLRYADNDACKSLVWLQRGHYYCFVLDDHEEQGIQAYTNAIKELPEDEEAYVFRGRQYLSKAYIEIAMKDEFDSINCRVAKSKTGEKWLKLAEKDFRKILEIKSNSLYGYTGMEEVCFIRGDLKEAERYAMKAIAGEGSADQSTYTHLMSIYIAQQRYSEAIDLTIYLIDNSINYEYKGFWVIALGEKSFTSLLAKLQLQANKQPDESVWYYYIAELYKTVKTNYDKAVEYGKKAYAIAPSSEVLASNTAHYMYLQGNYKGSIAYADRAIELNGDFASPVYIKAIDRYNLGHPQEAIELLTDAIRIAPSVARFYAERGFYRKHTHDNEQAIEDLSMAIELDPDDAFYYLSRGDAYMAIGERELAMADYHKTIAIDTVPEEGGRAMYAYQALGRNAEAIDYLQRLIEASDDKASAYYEAACLFSRMGKKTEATSYLEKCFAFGYNNVEHAKIDNDLENIRDTEVYKRLVENNRPKEYPEEVLPELPRKSKVNSQSIRSLAPSR